jgi:hypothetical protein
MVEPNIWAAFQAIGFEYDTVAEPYRLLFNEEKFRESKGFQELCMIDFPLDQLSALRRAANFGWIDQPEQNDCTQKYLSFTDQSVRYCPLSETDKTDF